MLAYSCYYIGSSTRAIRRLPGEEFRSFRACVAAREAYLVSVVFPDRVPDSNRAHSRRKHLLAADQYVRGNGRQRQTRSSAVSCVGIVRPDGSYRGWLGSFGSVGLLFSRAYHGLAYW